MSKAAPSPNLCTCGGSPKVERRRLGLKTRFFVRCLACHQTGRHKPTKSEAVEAWNEQQEVCAAINSTPTPEPSALIPCPFCGGAPYIERTRRFPDWDGYEKLTEQQCIESGGYCCAGICRSCGAQGPWEKSESAARHRWNKRV
jgi:Lar family restriction alleviation protein